MSASWNLHCLYSLDPSSPVFLRRLHSLFCFDEGEQYLFGLQGSELTRLLDFLDHTLGALPPNDDISIQCLRKLQAICSYHAALPSSYFASGEISRVGDHPIVVGGISDVWEGTYRNKRVSIEHLKISPNDDQVLKESFIEQAVMWKRLRHPNIVPFVGITTSPLQIISKWMPNGTLMDFVEGNPDANRISLLLDVAEGLSYLHANGTIHGNLKGPNIFVDRGGHARLSAVEFSSAFREVNSVAQGDWGDVAMATPESFERADMTTREMDVFAFGMVVMEVFVGTDTPSELAIPVVSEIMENGGPTRPEKAQELGLTDSVWDMTVQCWHQDPARRPTMVEVVRLLRKCFMLYALDLDSLPLPAARKIGITDLPVRLLTDKILPFCEVKDILSLGCTSKFFAVIMSGDGEFWRRKLAIDYNFTGSETNRTSGWKFVYLRLGRPRFFAWGTILRPAPKNSPKVALLEAPLPFETRLEHKPFVSLAVSGGALHALDVEGSVYVWGTLQPVAIRSPGREADFSSAATTATKWLKLQLPAPVRSISCGHLHSAALDTNSTIWTFRSWGQPVRLISPLLDCSSPETTPVQIECGNVFCAVLTKSGDIYAWWISSGTFYESCRKARTAKKVLVPDHETVIPCHILDVGMDPTRLPALPDLPDLPATGFVEEERSKETRLIKIAACDHWLIGLTNKGHILKLGGLLSEGSARIWCYLPNFSEIGKIETNPAFHPTTGDWGWKRPPQVVLSSDTLLITHISARGTNFFAYSSSMVLQGGTSDGPQSHATIIPELQNRSVISVVVGRDHFGALTSSGNFLTWGKYSGGALGLEDPSTAESTGGERAYTPPVVMVPTEVRFDHQERLKGEGRVNRYCFTVAAYENHTAALVVDLAGARLRQKI